MNLTQAVRYFVGFAFIRIGWRCLPPNHLRSELVRDIEKYAGATLDELHSTKEDVL